MNHNFEAYLWKVGFLVPIIIAAIGGCVWAGMNWKKASTPAMATSIACGVLILFSCIFPAMAIWIPPQLVPRQPVQMRPGDDPFFSVRWSQRGIEVCSHACTALCIGGLVFAAFANRAAAKAKLKSKRKDDDDDDGEDEKPRRKKRDDDDDD